MSGFSKRSAARAVTASVRHPRTDVILNKVKNLSLILSVLLLLSACREPASVETFLPGEGPYSFTLDMSDTTVVYNLDFYTRVDVPFGQEIPSEMPLMIQWRSPSDSLFREKVYLPLSADVYEPYRAGVSPVEAGVWTLTVYAPSAPEGLLGMGLVLTKEKDD